MDRNEHLEPMTPERHQRIKELFNRVAELDASQRARFLDDACGDDYELRREVQELVGHLEQSRAKPSIRMSPEERRWAPFWAQAWARPLGPCQATRGPVPRSVQPPVSLPGQPWPRVRRILQGRSSRGGTIMLISNACMPAATRSRVSCTLRGEWPPLPLPRLLPARRGGSLLLPWGLPHPGRRLR